VDPAAFADDQNWCGGFYELAVLVGPRDDARLDAAIRAAWADDRLDGCYADRREPADQERLVCSLAATDHVGHLRGTAVLPGGQRVVCGSVIIRDELAQRDWLDFYIPLGALSRADARVGGFSGESGIKTLAWRLPIDEWLAGMGRRIYRSAAFAYGLIGFEVSGWDLPATDGEERYISCLVPVEGDVHHLAATR
jgi:hypothetical protein